MNNVVVAYQFQALMTLIGTKIKLQSVAPFLRKRSVSWLRVCVSKGSVVGFRPTMPERDPEIVYSPSKWSKRFPGDVIVQKFLEITGNGKVLFNTHVVLYICWYVIPQLAKM